LTANDADATLKRSDQFTQDGGLTFPFANGISLTAGTKYYLELVHHDGTGGDNSSATWKKHTDPDPASGTASTLVGNVIGVYAPKCTYVAFTQQPANVSVQPMAIAALTVAGATDSTMPVGTINAPATNNFLVYQWQKNGVDIPGANAATLEYGPVLPTESGTVFTCKIRALGYVDASQNPLWSNSTPATLTVEQSVFEPGYAKVEYWPAATRAAVNAGTAGAPTWTTYVQQWDMGTDLADQYTRRFSGFFVPPATDSYAFYINADDDRLVPEHGCDPGEQADHRPGNAVGCRHPPLDGHLGEPEPACFQLLVARRRCHHALRLRHQLAGEQSLLHGDGAA